MNILFYSLSKVQQHIEPKNVVTCEWYGKAKYSYVQDAISFFIILAELIRMIVLNTLFMFVKSIFHNLPVLPTSVASYLPRNCHFGYIVIKLK